MKTLEAATQLKSSLKTFRIRQNNRPIPDWLVYSSLIFIFVAVFIKIWTPSSINRWPEAFYTLTFFYGLFRERSWLSKHPIVMGFFAAILATPVLFTINYILDPEAATKFAHFEKLARVYLFVPIGYWLSFNRNYIVPFLMAGFAGFLLACLSDPNFNTTVKNVLIGHRVSFGLQNWQHLAAWSGLFVILFSFLIFGNIKSYNSLKTQILLILNVTAFALNLFGFYGAQTRASYLGIGATILSATIIWLIHWTPKLTLKGKTAAAISFIVAFAIVSSALVFTDNPIKNRFKDEIGTAIQVLQGDLRSVRVDNTGLRIHSWAKAVEWIQEKPLIGWGGNVRKTAVKEVEAFSDYHRKVTGHFHNAYVEFLIAYGLIGLVIAFFPFIWQFWNHATSFNNANHWVVYGTLTGVFFLVINMFESYLFFWPGTYSIGLILAPSLAISIDNKRPE